MLAPIDKLRSGVNDIIQIVITTACTLNCSNCTQLLPFRNDYRHMSLECFREAVQSLKSWPGVIGIFGGNPCSHPQFEKICEILAEEIPEQWRRGLWSNDLLKHGYIVRKTFFPDGRFNLNAHGSYKAARDIELFLPGRLIPKSASTQSMHAPILVSHHDLGISDQDFDAWREDCDINQKWSGAIVEREGKPYAYFCEVAAAIEGVLGVNTGIPAVPGWWEESITHFEKQINTCDACAVPLRLKGRKDNEETYDISDGLRPYTNSKRPISIKDPSAEPSSNDPEQSVVDYMRFKS